MHLDLLLSIPQSGGKKLSLFFSVPSYGLAGDHGNSFLCLEEQEREDTDWMKTLLAGHHGPINIRLETFSNRVDWTNPRTP